MIGSRPGMGKTSLMLDMALHASFTENIPVFIFSLAESSQMLAMRILSRYGDYTFDEIEHDESACKLTAEKFIAEDEDVPLYLFDRAFTLQDIENTIYRSERMPGIIFIDYLQLLDLRTGAYSISNNLNYTHPDLETQEDLCFFLKRLAEKANIPIVVLSQVARKVEERTDKRPGMGDNCYSKEIENAADAVVFLYLEAYYDSTYASQKHVLAELIVAKNQHGETGTATVVFDRHILTFM